MLKVNGLESMETSLGIDEAGLIGKTLRVLMTPTTNASKETLMHRIK
jgi:hypothetical protein